MLVRGYGRKVADGGEIAGSVSEQAAPELLIARPDGHSSGSGPHAAGGTLASPLVFYCTQPATVMTLARLGRVVSIAAVLFAGLVWMLCAIGSLVGVLHGGRPDGFMVAFFAFFALALALAGRAIRDVLAGEGDLVVTAASGNLQVADLALFGARGGASSVSPIALANDEAMLPSDLRGGFAANVFLEYEAIARDLRDDASSFPASPTP